MDDLSTQQTLDEITSPENVLDIDELHPNDVQNENSSILEQLPSQSPTTPTPKMSPTFMKIQLTETDDALLYENNSFTVMVGTDDAEVVHEDNKLYDNLTIGKGNQRKTVNVETQTVDALYKSRAINTDRIAQITADTFVSNYDMFDTYADLERFTESLDLDCDDKHDTLDVTTYSKEGSDDLSFVLQKSQTFKLSSMILQRILAGNIFRESQRRFRNMEMPNPLDPVIQYLYKIKLLYKYRANEMNGCAISCLAWCPSNTDILAIGYGVFKYVSCDKRRLGAVCLWNIKNPVNPERFYKYSVAVTSVSFSNDNSQLLAIGFYDGTVEVIDVIDENSLSRVAVSQRKTSPPVEPVWNIKWIKIGSDEELLTVSQDGFIMKYTLTNCPFLIGRRQMRIEKIDGVVEGIPLDEKHPKKLYANRHSQAFVIQTNPINPVLYYAGTDEGCLHQCSIYYPYQHMNVLQVHKYGVFAMEFSPWSPKIFLTCGTDWCVRVWIEDITKPIIELRNGFEPIQCAYWCPTNSTIIVSNTRTRLDIWDLRTNCLLPAASHIIGGQISCLTANAEITVCRFTNCGRSIVVGDEDGSAFVYALEDMPFPPHFQYEALEQAILTKLTSNRELERQVKRMGFLGYP